MEKNTTTITDTINDNKKVKSSVNNLTTRLNTVEVQIREINSDPEAKSEKLYSIQNLLIIPCRWKVLHVTRVAQLCKDNDRLRSVVI